jgi:hypothetical protein
MYELIEKPNSNARRKETSSNIEASEQQLILKAKKLDHVRQITFIEHVIPKYLIDHTSCMRMCGCD